MKFFKASLTLSMLGFASAFTSTPSAFTPRLSTRPLPASSSSSSLHMVAEDAKVILVTGASRGLGRAIAVELGSQGQKIIVNYAGSEDAAKETVEMVKAAGGDAVAVKANCEYFCSVFVMKGFCNVEGVLRNRIVFDW
jgi:Dehydrogenases with different specificities (related to short-chain alcohol dehydrogenases)